MNKVKVSTGVSCNCDEKKKNQKKRYSMNHEIWKKKLELAIIKIIMGPTPRQPSLKHIVTLVTFFFTFNHIITSGMSHIVYLFLLSN